jgi:hypothetical protein
LRITMINTNLSNKATASQHETKSTPFSEGSWRYNLPKQRKPSFLHPNRTVRQFDHSRHLRLALNLSVTKPLIPKHSPANPLAKRRLKKTRIIQRSPFFRRHRFWRKPVKTFQASYFHKRLGQPRMLLKRQSYRNANPGSETTLFFRMFPERSQPAPRAITHFGLENSLFWFYGVHITQFSSESWAFHDLFSSASSLYFPIGKAPTRDVRSFKRNVFPDRGLPVINYENPVVAGVTTFQSYKVRDSAPTYYTLWLTSISQAHNSDTAFFLSGSLTSRHGAPLQTRPGPWIIHARRTNWLRYKSILLRHNIILKKTFRRIFSFYFYKVPSSLAPGGESKRFIPELPSALRGSSWSESSKVVYSAVADLWQNETAHELSRATPNRIPNVFHSSRVDNPQNSPSERRSNSAVFSSVLLNKLTHRHFKNTFYSKHVPFTATPFLPETNSLAYYARKRLTSPLSNLSASLNLPNSKRYETVFKASQTVKKRSECDYSGATSSVHRIHSFDTKTSTLSEVISPLEEAIQGHMVISTPYTLAPRVSMKLRRTIRRRLRVLKSRARWKLRRYHRRTRFLTRIRLRLRRATPWRLRASKARRPLWRRSQRFLHTTLNLSKRPSKPKNYRNRNQKTRNHKIFNQTYRSTVKQFNSQYSRSYRPVICSLVLNEILGKDTSSYRSLGMTIEAGSVAPSTPTQSNRSTLLASLGSHIPTLIAVWASPILLKYAFLSPSFGEKNSRLFENNHLSNSIVGAFTRRLQNQLSAYFFGTQSKNLRKLNIWNVQCANYVLRKRLLRVSSNSLFLPQVTMWYYRTLVRFVENCTGRRVALHFGPFAEGALTFEDRAQVSIWSGRVMGFQKMLGHKIFAQEALMLITVSVRLKDPTFLANWIRGMLKRLSFWKYRLIFRYLKYVIRHLFKSNFDHFQFKGFKLRLKGKISVAGNARTRTLSLRVGDTSHSKMDNRVAYDLSYVETFTGVLGFKLWFFY